MAARSYPPTSTRPREAFANPPITYKSDDLPQPEGPITATDSPGETSKFTPRKAGTSTLPARYSFQRFSVLSIGSTLLCPEAAPAEGPGIVAVISMTD